ncbi:hypothetical protein CIT31_24400 [Mesorhizobium wenxiniae]|uniref:Uncharacterized protein n=1 Tax=Mesorhizobium wenxiniae TaxID=2014805 RepID=A0A271KAY4_9HYPH|nr:hypothetical protein CIT31_24400 [Mesorhizobium wenxiniae]
MTSAFGAQSSKPVHKADDRSLGKAFISRSSVHTSIGGAKVQLLKYAPSEVAGAPVASLPLEFSKMLPTIRHSCPLPRMRPVFAQSDPDEYYDSTT